MVNKDEYIILVRHTHKHDLLHADLIVNDTLLSSGIGMVLPHHSTVTTCQGTSLLQGIQVSVTSQSARLDPN